MSRHTPTATRPPFAGYGIAAADEGEGLLPWHWAEERLERARNYFIATTRPEGRPHVMVVWGVWVEDRFAFSTSPTSRKAKNLAANGNCVICPGDAEEAVIVEGSAAVATDAALRARIAEAYKAKYGMIPSDEEGPLYVVRPRVVYGQIEESFTKSATRWTFAEDAAT
jgi:hypothetical protein